MKPTMTDEIIACIVQLSADIEEITDILEYIKPINERLKTLVTELEGKEVTA